MRRVLPQKLDGFEDRSSELRRLLLESALEGLVYRDWRERHLFVVGEQPADSIVRVFRIEDANRAAPDCLERLVFISLPA